jgi:hypothetical protein
MAAWRKKAKNGGVAACVASAWRWRKMAAAAME